MLKNYLRVALRNVRRQRGYAAINVFGLALGMACCLLILTLVRHEWSYDRFHARGERIHRVLIQETPPGGGVEYRSLTPPDLAPAMDASFPAVEHLTRVVLGPREFRLDEDLVSEGLMMVDSTFFDVFTFPLLAGDAATALDDPQHVVLTDESAERHFGAADASVLGRTITVEDGDETRDFTVSGVLAPIPETSSLQFDVLMSFRNYETLYVGSNDWGGRTSLYVLMAEGQSPAALEAAFPPFTATQMAERIEERRASGFLADGADAFRLVLQPLARLHVEPDRGVTYEVTPFDPKYGYVLLAIAGLVLAIACINFITLSLGRSTTRAREVGVRKALGAQRGQLQRQFWGEAILLSAIALPLGLGLAALALPTFNTLTGKTFTLAGLTDPLSLAAMVGLAVLVGLAAGSYPSVVLARFQPTEVLRGGAKVSGKNPLARGLVVAQYAVSVALIACTLVMYRQVDFLLNRDLGFDAEQVVVLQTPRLTTAQERHVLDVFRQEAVGRAGVVNVVKTGYSFTRGGDTYGWTEPDGTNYEVHNVGVDHDYLDVMGMQLVAGRWFSPEMPSDSTGSVVVNEAFVRTYGLEEPVGHVLAGLDTTSFFGTPPTIIGVVRDFNFSSLREEVAPAMLNMHPGYYMGMGALLVRIRPEDVPGTMALLEATWEGVFPDKPFAFSFLDEDLDAQYEDERRWRAILTDSAALAVLVACLGLFGLATLAVAKRRKELGVRKVLGARSGSLALLVAREFVALVLVAVLIAAPVSYLAMDRWLEGFAYRTPLGPGVFFIAGALALVIALLTVSTQALRAAAADPVKALRSE
ncbi:MAG TPA: ABC transporter permease [Rhodothermales bacterium]|nr:ABC transporter permease [Rhodothermales bacterium]